MNQSVNLLVVVIIVCKLKEGIIILSTRLHLLHLARKSTRAMCYYKSWRVNTRGRFPNVFDFIPQTRVKSQCTMYFFLKLTPNIDAYIHWMARVSVVAAIYLIHGAICGLFLAESDQFECWMYAKLSYYLLIFYVS